VSLRAVAGLLFWATQVLLPALGAAQYLGFDRNDYPGDANLPVLRQTFAYAGYWLSNPPGENSNSWVGKRSVLQNAGFGFLVLFNGRRDAQLRHDAVGLGRADGQAAIAAARREDFPAHTIIFLDLEEGGHMSPQQKSYIYAWVDTINANGFYAGVYCSGIPVQEDKNTIIVTADDIRANRKRDIRFWVVQDSCPPSPGCIFPKQPASPSGSGITFAEVWQFVRSPKQVEFTGTCGGYNADGSCYPPGFDPAAHLHVDVNTATSEDPSHGR
jgi:hypothetical protein